MNAISEYRNHDSPPESEAPASETPFEHQLAEAEALVNEMKHLLVMSQHVLNYENIRSEVEIIERWLESYRRGLSAAKKLSVASCGILKDVRNRLKLAVEEVQRMENESNNPVTPTQAEEIEEFIRASLELEKLAPLIEQMFCPTCENEPAETEKKNNLL